MKKLGLAIIILFSSIALQAQEKINWLTLPEAIELNKTEPRKFMIDVYTDWCGWCKRMDAMTFSNDTIIKYVNEHYYAVKFNAEMKESMKLGNKIYHFVDNGRRGYHEVAAILTKGKLSYPTIVYLDEELKHIDVDPGFKSVKALKPVLIYNNEGKYIAKKNPMDM